MYNTQLYIDTSHFCHAAEYFRISLHAAMHDSKRNTHSKNEILYICTLKHKSMDWPISVSEKCIIGLNASFHDVYVKFVSASPPFTHAWTPEKNCLILIILPRESFPYFDY